MPSLSPRPPSPRHRGVCVQRSQPPGKGTARVWLSQWGLVGAVGGTVYGGARSRNGDGSHGNSSLLSQRSRIVLRERWLRCSDTVRGFRPGHVPLCVPDITARFLRREPGSLDNARRKSIEAQFRTTCSKMRSVLWTESAPNQRLSPLVRRDNACS